MFLPPRVRSTRLKSRHVQRLRLPGSHPPASVHHALKMCLALDVLHGAGTTQVRQWRQKRVLMRSEAAFPYVSAAEGAQHPPKKPPRSTPPPPRPTSQLTPQLIPRHTPPSTSQPHPIPHPAATTAAGVQSFSALCA